MSKVLRTAFRPVYPTPAALVTSVTAQGAPNIIALGEVFNVSISKPVWVGLAIRKATYSHGLLCAQKEFVVNLPTAGMIDQVLECGSVSGRDCPDKFAAFGLTPVPATQVAPPLIDECPVNLECRLVNVTETGDHDLFLGEVVAQHVDSALLDDDGDFLTERFDTLVMMPGGFCSVGPKLNPTVQWPRKRK